MLIGTPRTLNDLLAIFGIGVPAPTNETMRDLLSSLKQPAKYTTRSLAGGVPAAAGELTGAANVTMNNSGVNPGTYATRTAAQMIAEGLLSPGDSYNLRIVNGQGTGNLTLGNGGDANVTLTGSMIIAVNAFRDFVVTCTGAGTLTIQSTATGTFS